TKQAQAQRDEAYDLGLTPILLRDLARISRMVESVADQLKDTPLYFFAERKADALIEHAVSWEIDGVKGQSKFDFLLPDLGIIVDPKLTTNAAPFACQRKILDMGYDIQAALYPR